MASHNRVRLDGVCDQPVSSGAREAVDARVLVSVRGGDAASTLVGLVWFAVEVRVARLRGEDSCAVAVAVATAVSGSGNSFGWFRVATIVAFD